MSREDWRQGYQKYLATPYWQGFRSEFLAEHGRKCQRCSKVGGTLDLHHKSYSILYHEREYPHLIEILCRNCHDKEHPEQVAANREMNSELREARLPLWVTPEEEERERLEERGVFEPDDESDWDDEDDEDNSLFDEDEDGNYDDDPADREW